MKKSLLSMCLLGLSCAPAITLAQQPVTCATASEQDVASLFDTWNNTLATSDATKVSELYVSDAVLLPAISN